MIARILSGIAVLTGLYECIVGLLQLTGLMHSLNPRYAVTGTFYNPGPYGCFLAIIFPIILYKTINSTGRLQKLSGTGMLIISAFLISTTLSRTAWLAVITGSIIAMRKDAAREIRRIPVIWIAAWCIITVALASGAYVMKKDSAYGRVLMWEIAAKAAKESPATGVGWENVAGFYGEAQEKYFSTGNRHVRDIMVAGAPEYVFNEYLQVAIAYGPVAAAILIILIAGGMITSLRSGNDAIAGSIAAIAIVMFASYPLQFPVFTVTIALLIACGWLSSSSRIAGYGTTAFIAILCTLFLTCANAPTLQYDFETAHRLHRGQHYAKSNQLLLKMMHHASDPMVLNIIGKNYQALGKPDSAEYYFKKSINRCPNRMYPRYLLMKLYSDSNVMQTDACLETARNLLAMPVKVKSPATDDMRREALQIINTYEL